MSNEVNEKEKLKAFLVEIMLNPNKNHDSMNYQWYPKYQIHATYAGLLHHKGYVKYGLNGNMVNSNYVITERGKKWLAKQQGDKHGTNE
jgi:hypothetical protein